MSKQLFVECDLFQTSQEAQKIYTHFLNCVQTESTSEVLANFRHLFIERKEYNNKEIHLILEKIAQSDQKFKIVLNHCCWLLIHYWHTKPEHQPAILELVALFDSLPSPCLSSSRLSSGEQSLVQAFTETEQYLRLKRLARIFSPHSVSQKSDSQCLGDLLKRYPYLYKHYLLNSDNCYEAQQTIKNLKIYRKKCFELALAKYMTYKMRLVEIARARQLSTGAGKILQRVNNPTLLSEDEFNNALKIFVGLVKNRSPQDSLLTEGFIPSYQGFKDSLYQYLISEIPSKSGKSQFERQLYDKLQSILPNYHSQPLSEFLILRTCSQLVNFLVADSCQRPNHYVVMNLVSNLGATQMTVLLLKLIVLCPKVKPSVEKQLSLLFEHYESDAKERVVWLIKLLENVLIAFSVCLKKTDWFEYIFRDF